MMMFDLFQGKLKLLLHFCHTLNEILGVDQLFFIGWIVLNLITHHLIRLL
jgi:hypothetical protein